MIITPIMEYLIQLFLPVTIWFQQVNPGWIAVMKAITFFGNIEFYLFILPALYWCIHPALGIRMASILLVSGIANSVFKLSFQSPRPYWISPQVEGYISENSFGFPSGHAQNAVGIWGLLSLSVKHWTVKLICWIGILFIGFSRVFLGGHFLHDVLFGWMIGGILLYIFIKIEPVLPIWIEQFAPHTKILLLFLSTAAVLLTAGIIFTRFYPPTTPGEWLEVSGEQLSPGNLDTLITSLGALFGLGAGVILLQQRGNFQGTGSTLKRVIRFPVGVVGVLLLWGGLGSIFPDDGTYGAMVLRYVRYSLIGLWISVGAPFVFTWLNLAAIPPQNT